jgi:WD40 repeat protein
MAKLKIACPACGTTLTVDEVHLGKTGRCKQCGAKFPIKAHETPSAEVTQPAWPRPMAQAKVKTADTTQPAKTGRAPVVMPASEATQPAESATPARHRQTDVTQPAGVAPGSGQRPAEVTIPQDEPKKAQDIKLAEDQVAAEWNVGDVILDTYEVKQVHTGGGMGLVYRVHHRNWNMDLAVKSPRAEFFATEQQKADFIRECETWINLGLHPNIVSCYYVRTLGGIPRVFAEYVEGGSLKDWIDSRKLYEGGPEEALKRILDIAIQMAWGLHYAHEHEDENKQKRELVHQDFKPANVMMTPDGEAKVTDFGLARARAGEGLVGVPDHGQQSILVSSGGMTPAYCSPEQANGEKLTRATDIWSWGLSVLEMFTGGVTWMAGQAALEALDTFQASYVDDIFIPRMPNSLVVLLRQCFQPRPADRPKDVIEVVDALREMYQQVAEEPYIREQPKAADLLADGLNNRAVSMLDLGQVTDAEALYERALEKEPHHPEATFNRGLLLWRSGQLTDTGLLAQLENASKAPHNADLCAYLTGLVHIERGHAPAALEAFQRTREGPHAPGIHKNIALATEGAQAWVHRISSLSHDCEVQSAVLSSDGSQAITVAKDRLTSWDVTTGQCLKTVANTGSVHNMFLSRDDGLLLTVGTKICWWDAKNLDPLCTFEDRPPSSLAFAASSDATVVACGDLSGGLVGTFAGRRWQRLPLRQAVTAVALSPDGHTLATTNKYGLLSLWNISSSMTATRSYRLSMPLPGLGWLAFAEDGRSLFAAAYRGANLVDLVRGTIIAVNIRQIIHQLCLSANLEYALVDQQVYKLTPCQCLHTLPEGTVRPPTISRDGHFAGLIDGNRLHIYRLGFGQAQHEVICRPKVLSQMETEAEQVHRLRTAATDALSSGDYAAASGFVRKAVAIRPGERPQEWFTLLRQIGAHGCRTALTDVWHVRELGTGAAAMAVDNRRATIARHFAPDTDGLLKVVDLATGETLSSGEWLDSRMTACVDISPDGCLAVSGPSAEGRGSYCSQLWAAPSGKHVRELASHEQSISSVAFSPDGRLVASAGRDGRVCISRANGEEGGGVIAIAEDIVDIAFSPSGRSLVTLSSGPYKCGPRSAIDSCFLRVWSTCSLQPTRSYAIHTPSVMPLSLRADGTIAMVKYAGHENELLLWDAIHGDVVRRIRLPRGRTQCAALSSDGKFVAAGVDNTLAILDCRTGACLRTIQHETGNVNRVSLSPDGNHLLSYDGCCHQWSLAWEYEFPTFVVWDDRVQPLLDAFLAMRCDPGRTGGMPDWNYDDYERLVSDLSDRGFGWLASPHLRQALEALTAQWREPSALLY